MYNSISVFMNKMALSVPLKCFCPDDVQIDNSLIHAIESFRNLRQFVLVTHSDVPDESLLLKSIGNLPNLSTLYIHGLCQITNWQRTFESNSKNEKEKHLTKVGLVMDNEVYNALDGTVAREMAKYKY